MNKFANRANEAWAVCTTDGGYIGSFQTKAEAYAALPLCDPVGRKLPSGVYEVRDRVNDQDHVSTFYVGKPDDLAHDGWRGHCSDSSQWLRRARVIR